MRLIDADKLIDKLEIDSPDPEGVDEWIRIINNEPTVCDMEYGCKYCKNNGDTCLECEYDGITKGYTRFEPIEKNVIEQIRQEIDQKQYDFMNDTDYDEGIRFGLMLAYQIIDKYTKGDKE